MLYPELSEPVALDIYRIIDSNIFWGFDSNTNHYFVADTDSKTVIAGDFESFEEVESSAFEYREKYV